MKPETLEMKNYRHGRLSDPILIKYQPSELRIAAEFLTNFLPFLTKDLCNGCTQTLAEQIRSLDSEVNFDAESSIPSEDYAVLSVNHQDMHMDGENNCDNWKCEVNPGSGWNDGPSGWSSDEVVDVSGSGTEDKVVNVDPPSVRMSWADMAQEDELEEDEEGEGEDGSKESVAAEDLNLQKSGEKGQRLSREQREYLRFMNVQRKKDFICFERIKARLVNVVEGLELHSGVFSVVEQKKIVDFIYRLQEMGGKGELKARTYSSPKKWMKGKGRITIQFGCCYNYATVP
ncbi:hypothetical protein GIB67_003879 [Kingdonia uniflora]|uniref:Uncharacterized protein n=1 Tax=Kingdonia uniflora TaxID=39325 RepID=A0A7J7LJX9_9MAGN|nr:hypothetical protein GIB67_003879 [Kingdonia uniflora]